MPEVRPLSLDSLLEIRPRRFADERGYFVETWNEEGWREAGIDCRWVQDNQSLSRSHGVLRGLHFQVAPMAQDKLVHVLAGSIFDVAVDLRKESSTFRQWAGVSLSADEGNQLFIPAGFAHGFVTLAPDTVIAYKVSAPYSPAHERAIRFDDPDLAIDWPVDPADLILSDRDRAAPSLAEVLGE